MKILDSEKDLISNSDMMIQVGLPSDENLSYLRENQILIGALNPFLNKDKIDNLIKKKVKTFLWNFCQGLLEHNQWIFYHHKQI